MTLSTAIANDMAFKDLMRKAFTSLNTAFYAENRQRIRYMPAQFILGEDIPSTPPATDTDIIEWYDVPLMLDNGVPDRRSWAIPKPGLWESGWDNSKDQSIVGRGFVDPGLGGPLWIAKLYRGSARGGARVPETHTSDWVVDYDAGWVTFNTEAPLELGATIADSPRLVLGRYRGKSIMEVVQSAGKVMLLGDIIGSRDGVNMNFQLPAPVGAGMYFDVRCAGQIVDKDDYSIASNGIDIKLAVPPYAWQKMDVVYYP